jgi:hypothetical protein
VRDFTLMTVDANLQFFREDDSCYSTVASSHVKHSKLEAGNLNVEFSGLLLYTVSDPLVMRKSRDDPKIGEVALLFRLHAFFLNGNQFTLML